MYVCMYECMYVCNLSKHVGPAPNAAVHPSSSKPTSKERV
jgi:hypothetical protein